LGHVGGISARTPVDNVSAVASDSWLAVDRHIDLPPAVDADQGRFGSNANLGRPMSRKVDVLSGF